MAGDDYSSAIRGGLKLKGFKPGGVKKKKKKSKPSVPSSETAQSALQVAASGGGSQPKEEKEADKEGLIKKRDSLVKRIRLLEVGGDQQSESEESAMVALIAARKELESLHSLIVAAPNPMVAKIAIEDAPKEEERGYKTPAQIRQEEMKRKRLEEKFEKEGGVKTHKERVEELNRYLSGLSEHHDMPKIGPG